MKQRKEVKTADSVFATAQTIKASLPADMTQSLKQQKLASIFKVAQQYEQEGQLEEALELAFLCKELLPINYWQDERELALRLYMFIAQLSFNLSYRAQAFSHLQRAEYYAQTSTEKLQLSTVYAYGYMVVQDVEALRLVVKQAFRLSYGYETPTEVTRPMLKRLYRRIRFKLKKHNEQSLQAIHTLDTLQQQLLVKIVVYFISLQSSISQQEQAYYVFHLLLLTLKGGVVEEQAIIYMQYAVVAGVLYNDMFDRQRFKELALEIVQVQQNVFIQLQVYRTYCKYCELWEPSFHTYARAVQMLLQAANKEPKQLRNEQLSLNICRRAFTLNSNLHEVYETICFHLTFQQMLQTKEEQTILQQYKAAIQLLRSEDNGTQAADFLQHEQLSMIQLHSSFFINKKRHMEQLEQQPFIINISNEPEQRYLLLYRAFLLLDQLQANHFTRQAVEVEQLVKQFKYFATVSPARFEHLYVCLLAKRLQQKGKHRDACMYYERALRLAKSSHSTLDALIIMTQLRACLEKSGEQQYLMQATSELLQTIEKWNAVALLQLMEPKQHAMLTAKQQSYSIKLIVDMMQSLAKKIKMEHLVKELLQLTLRHTNATASYFVRVQQHEQVLTAFIETNSYQYRFYENGMAVPEELRNYIDFVVQCEEPLVIDDAQKAALLASHTRRVKSLVCMPVFYKGKIRAVLYLENDLYAYAFNEEHLHVLRLVCTQIAISLDHAEIYEELERRVLQRTILFEELNSYLQGVNERLLQHETNQKLLFEGVSHQLRSPITSALGYIEAIIDQIVTDEGQQRQLIEKSKERLLQLQQLIEQLFKLVSYEAGRIGMYVTTGYASDWLKRLQTMLYQQFHDKQLVMIDELNSDPFIQIDEQKMIDAIQAIIKYFATNGSENCVVIRVFSEHRILYMQLEGANHHFVKAEPAQLFEAYFLTAKLDDTPMTGIELAICKKIVELHQGTITLQQMDQNRVGFTIAIPL